MRGARPRRRNTHKGDYGRVLAITGSLGMAGAAGISALAALRAGAGGVTVACPGGDRAHRAGALPLRRLPAAAGKRPVADAGTRAAEGGRAGRGLRSGQKPCGFAPCGTA